MQDLIELIKLEDGILQINLNRPEQLNALNHQVLVKLSDILNQVKHDAFVKAILLTGQGKAFCAGADIKELNNLDGREGIAFAQYGQKVFRELELLGKPSLAAIQGVALGGGCELVMAATLRIAADNAFFGQPEIKLGVIPGFGGTQRLSRLIGKGRALEICLTGRRFSAEEALRWGFINAITTPSELIAEAKKLLHQITQLPIIAAQSIIAVIQQGYNLSLEEACQLEAAYFGFCCTTADKREGVSAFLEKRNPIFQN